MERIEHYRFSSDIRQAVREYCQIDNWHGCLAWIEDFSIIGGAIALPCMVSWYFYPLSIVLIGSRQRALATLLHESAHQTLAQNKALNFILGTFGSGYLILQTMTSYRDSHVRGHHGHFGNFCKDPDYAFMLDQGVYERDLSDANFAWRYVWSPLLLVKTPEYLYSLVAHRLFEQGSLNQKNSRELALMGAWWLIILSGVTYVHCWGNFILLWVVPYLTVFQIVGWFIELAEHYPLMNTNVDLYMSRNRHSAWLEKGLTGMHNESFHLVHHLFPSVPFWHVHKVHALLLQDQNYASHDSKQGGIFWSVSGRTSVLRQCLTCSATKALEA